MHAIPVANDDGTLFGMMSREDIASYNMGTLKKQEGFVYV